MQRGDAQHLVGTGQREVAITHLSAASNKKQNLSSEAKPTGFKTLTVLLSLRTSPPTTLVHFFHPLVLQKPNITEQESEKKKFVLKDGDEAKLKLNVGCCEPCCEKDSSSATSGEKKKDKETTFTVYVYVFTMERKKGIMFKNVF